MPFEKLRTPKKDVPAMQADALLANMLTTMTRSEIVAVLKTCLMASAGIVSVADAEASVRLSLPIQIRGEFDNLLSMSKFLDQNAFSYYNTKGGWADAGNSPRQ